jgi:peptidoglycan hydrolase-like protein with peptidoglycan-binding domain
VLGGVVAGSLLDHHEAPDPLGLGVSLVNQPCSDESLVVTVTGTSFARLATAVSEDPDHVRYLDIARSCPTAWNAAGTRRHGYATYLGPYDSVGKACAVRMTAAHRGDLVTRLRSGGRAPMQCVCYLDYATMPTLRTGMGADALDGIYVFALQDLLTSIGLNPPAHSTGLYDTQTVQEVTEFQRSRALPANGVVDAATWHSLQGPGCQDRTD